MPVAIGIAQKPAEAKSEATAEQAQAVAEAEQAEAVAEAQEIVEPETVAEDTPKRKRKAKEAVAVA